MIVCDAYTTFWVKKTIFNYVRKRIYAMSLWIIPACYEFKISSYYVISSFNEYKISGCCLGTRVSDGMKCKKPIHFVCNIAFLRNQRKIFNAFCWVSIQQPVKFNSLNVEITHRDIVHVCFRSFLLILQIRWCVCDML